MRSPAEPDERTLKELMECLQARTSTEFERETRAESACVTWKTVARLAVSAPSAMRVPLLPRALRDRMILIHI